MAKISTYPIKPYPTLSDYVIGTDAENSKITKNFLISDILALIASENYVPYTGASKNVNLGTNTITANNFIKLGGTSSQFLKADGSIDSNSYITSLSLNNYVPYTGATTDVSLGAKSLSGFDITANNSLNTNGPFKTSNNAGTINQILSSNGPGVAPEWKNPAIVNVIKGSFYDTVNQTATLINTAYRFIFRNTDLLTTNGVVINNNSLGLPSRITVSETGVYNIQFSAQVYRGTGGSSQNIDIWLRANENNVVYSNTTINVQANQRHSVASWNFFLYLQANQYAEIMWSTTDIDIYMLAAIANGIHPATPSIILTVNKV